MPGEGAPEPGFLAEAELQRRDRDKLIAVLKKANWKIKGRDGAAELLGVNSATFLARTKKWGDPKTGGFLRNLRLDYRGYTAD